jgi:hypothetical protein
MYINACYIMYQRNPYLFKGSDMLHSKGSMQFLNPGASILGSTCPYDPTTLLEGGADGREKRIQREKKKRGMSRIRSWLLQRAT